MPSYGLIKHSGKLGGNSSSLKWNSVVIASNSRAVADAFAADIFDDAACPLEEFVDVNSS
jgi:hypothetical protein